MTTTTSVETPTPVLKGKPRGSAPGRRAGVGRLAALLLSPSLLVLVLVIGYPIVSALRLSFVKTIDGIDPDTGLVVHKSTYAAENYTGIILVPNVVERTPPYVEEVIPGSPADKAKIKPDDLIVYIDGLPVNDINAFNTIMAGYGPGQEPKLEIQRGEKLTTVPIKLQKLPPKKKK